MPEENKNNDIMDFGFATGTPSIIKVIGVGGGGGNAVNHMYREGIHDVTFALCNTDCQVLSDSPIPTRLQLGHEGLGVGGVPEKAREAAEESLEDIRAMLDDDTRMVFITAGMGGGTGTGAAPVIAREAKAKGILTVGIVTIPFRFEGNVKIDLALDGVEELSKHVDALLVINNERLREIYTDLSFLDAFAKADDTLSIAAKSIAEIITTHGRMNLDFNDVCSVLRDGGVAIMSYGYGEGENRVSQALDNALKSPLLNNNDIYNARNIVLCIYCSEDEGGPIGMEEFTEIHNFMGKFKKDYRSKWGVTIDPSLGKKVKITLLAAGFGLESVPGMDDVLEKYRKEDAERIAQEKEEAEEREQRRAQFYPTDDSARHRKHRHQIYRFGAADIDDDDVISMVEATPTHKRSKENLQNIRDKAAELASVEPAVRVGENAAPILF